MSNFNLEKESDALIFKHSAGNAFGGPVPLVSSFKYDKTGMTTIDKISDSSYFVSNGNNTKRMTYALGGNRP